MAQAQTLLLAASTVPSPAQAQVHMNNLGGGGGVTLIRSAETIAVEDTEIIISAPAQVPDIISAELAQTVLAAESPAELIEVEAEGELLPIGDKPTVILADGPDTATSDSTSISLIAGENLSANKVVYVSGGQAFIADHTVSADMARIVGITQNAALVGAAVTVQTADDMTLGSWNWAPGSLWLGTNGAMTQVRPLTGFLIRVATAVSPTVINIDVEEGIHLA